MPHFGEKIFELQQDTHERITAVLEKARSEIYAIVARDTDVSKHSVTGTLRFTYVVRIKPDGSVIADVDSKFFFPFEIGFPKTGP